MAQIAAERDAEWQSNRDDKSKSKLIKAPPKKKDDRQEKSEVERKARTAQSGAAGSLPKKELAKLPAGKPRFIPPMKPRLLEDAARRPAIGSTS